MSETRLGDLKRSKPDVGSPPLPATSQVVGPLSKSLAVKPALLGGRAVWGTVEGEARQSVVEGPMEDFIVDRAFALRDAASHHLP